MRGAQRRPRPQWHTEGAGIQSLRRPRPGISLYAPCSTGPVACLERIHESECRTSVERAHLPEVALVPGPGDLGDSVAADGQRRPVGATWNEPPIEARGSFQRVTRTFAS